MPPTAQIHSTLWVLMASTFLPLVASLPMVRTDASGPGFTAASCRACEAFNSDEGFFAVVNDCQWPNKVYVSTEAMQQNAGCDTTCRTA